MIGADFVAIRSAEPVGPGDERIDVGAMQPVAALIPEVRQGGLVCEGPAPYPLRGLQDDTGDATIAEFEARANTGGAGPDLASQLYSRFRDQIDELSIGKPTLEDVFIARTGSRFEEQD